MQSPAIEPLPRFQSPLASRSGSIGRIAFLGSYPPRRCGIATFTNDLLSAVGAAVPEADCIVAAMGREGLEYPPEVRFLIQERDPASYRRAATALNRADVEVLCLQHEFGIFGGPAGSFLIPLLREVKMPVVTTLHSVLATPDVEQRKVMEELIRRSARLVVMARRGADILCETYGADPRKIDVIPHGIPDLEWSDGVREKERLGLAGRKVLLTFGLLGPGKGIEYGIRALPQVAAAHPEALYMIVGATHPNLVACEGEKYRESLKALAVDLGVAANVRFEERYLPMEELLGFMAAADIYLTPYPNEAQITSGTLAQAYGAGKAVISTPYWHAHELLEDGSGILVPSRDSGAICDAIQRLLDNPPVMEELRRKAYEGGRAMIWPRVGHLYRESFIRAREETPKVAEFPARRAVHLPPLKLDHIARMTDGTGIFQHALFDVPNYREGYCTDDNARAFILCNQLDGSGDPLAERLSTTYLAFLAAAFNEGNGRFRNFMSHQREWLEEAGSEDSHGRALWSVATGAAWLRNDGRRLLSLKLFQGGLPAVESFTSPRAWAFTLIGLHEYLKTFPGDLQAHRMRLLLVERLIALWERHSRKGWNWFEDVLSYDNARLPQALIASGARLPETKALEVGLAALEWLVEVQTSGTGHFRPIGSEGFYRRGGERAGFDQQPLEAQATVAACLEAWRVTGEKSWQAEAERAFDWFLGHNDVGLPLYDGVSGGCCDGLQPDRVNANQGAESSLAFTLSLVELKQASSAAEEPVKQTA